MMFNINYLSNQLKKKINNNTQIVQLYSDELFSKYYDNISGKGKSLQRDIIFYKNNINPNKLTLEIASGNGRVISSLLDENFNVKGIEKEATMIEQMEYKYRSHIYQNDVFEFDKLNKIYSQADYIIIPATSISLFSAQDIELFIQNLINLNKSFVLMFDFIDIESLINEKPKKEKNELGTFYIQNFKVKQNDIEVIVYNIFHKESNKLGYSVKFSHNKELFMNIMKNCGLSCEIKINNNNYYMIKGEFNGK